MKLENLVESDPRVGGTPSEEEMLNTFMDQVKGMNVRSLQSLTRELVLIANERGLDIDTNPSEVADPRVLLGIIGNFGFGAPVVTTIMEELIALGVKRFLSIDFFLPLLLSLT